MRQRSSREEFAAAFIELVEKTDSANISVVDLTCEVGCSRKTFYRYFEDIEDLITWYFRNALMRIALDLFPHADHVKPDPSLRDKYSDMPFYARIVGESGELNQAAWTAAVASHFEENSKYYAIIYSNDTNL